MRDVMKRSRRGGGKVSRYTGRTLPDGREVLVPVGLPASGTYRAMARHLGKRGDVTDGCVCAECKAAGMAPPVEASARLREATRVKLAKLKAATLAAIIDCRWAMTATILRKRDGSKSTVKRTHNDASRKLKLAAAQAHKRYKRAAALAGIVG